mmetsp:Transcript_39057/g.63860  ORF Transcript_39057/g.63860 Transcript_39057/m.63860 type:complete len:221 (+) Transcript_39057:593-1255(+)
MIGRQRTKHEQRSIIQWQFLFVQNGEHGIEMCARQYTNTDELLFEYDGALLVLHKLAQLNQINIEQTIHVLFGFDGAFLQNALQCFTRTQRRLLIIVIHATNQVHQQRFHLIGTHQFTQNLTQMIHFHETHIHHFLSAHFFFKRVQQTQLIARSFMARIAQQLINEQQHLNRLQRQLTYTIVTVSDARNNRRQIMAQLLQLMRLLLFLFLAQDTDETFRQ